jgi:2-oxoglutarate ferredoxin oxidoreductase subunit beta
VKAGILSRFFDNPRKGGDHFPRPFGVFYSESRPCYEDGMSSQIAAAIEQKGAGDLDKLLRGRDTWEIQ